MRFLDSIINSGYNRSNVYLKEHITKLLMNFAALILVIAFGFSGSILIRFYRQTKISDFLLFSFTSWVVVIRSSIELIFGISPEMPLIESQNATLYLYLQIFFHIIGPIASLSVFLIGYRGRWRKGRPSILFFTIIWFVILEILALCIRVSKEVDYFTVMNFKINNTISEPGRIAILKIGDSFIYGQGFAFPYILFRIFCSFYLLYSILKAQNDLGYQHHMKLQFLWFIALFAYILSQFIIVVQTLTSIPIDSTFILIFQAITACVFLIVSIWYPEGLILSRVQIIRALKVMQEANIEFGENKRFMSIKLIEYLEYLAQNESKLSVKKLD